MGMGAVESEHVVFDPAMEGKRVNHARHRN